MPHELQSTARMQQLRGDEDALSDSEVSELDLTWANVAANEVADATQAVSDVDAESSDSQVNNGNDSSDDDADAAVSDSGSEYDPSASATSEDFSCDEDSDSVGLDSDSVCSEADSACWSDDDGLGPLDDLSQRQYAGINDGKARAGSRSAKAITIKSRVSVIHVSV
ncbi:hypothetical protein OPT61_g6879 [Boeremia exigua]|uniref:Uncharacterized protein n=1 Tax=Boeremia exigua TaxID=749465 RepID=A0ACC2I4F4_9PLEO|nr:hypothetical protein OPT61_g6879 [Boeremia exigua]